MTAHCPKIVWFPSEEMNYIVTASGYWDRGMSEEETKKWAAEKGGWNAGTHPPAWIQVEFPAELPVSCVTALYTQSPGTCNTHHRVFIGNSADSLKLVSEEKGETTHLQPFQVNFEQEYVRFVRVHTVSSLSWVAWENLKIGCNDLAIMKAKSARK